MLNRSDTSESFSLPTLECRQPGLIKQRYSYDDQRLCCTPPVIPNVARLKELPLQLQNWHSAVVPEELTRCDSYYQPSHVVGKKYKGQCRINTFQYVSWKPAYLRPISGYDPNIFLPAQQADRSKISIEYYMSNPYLLADPYLYKNHGN